MGVAARARRQLSRSHRAAETSSGSAEKRRRRSWVVV